MTEAWNEMISGRLNYPIEPICLSKHRKDYWVKVKLQEVFPVDAAASLL